MGSAINAARSSSISSSHSLSEPESTSSDRVASDRALRHDVKELVSSYVYVEVPAIFDTPLFLLARSLAARFDWIWRHFSSNCASDTLMVSG